MFDLFKSKEYHDPELGTFRRRDGVWRGQLAHPQLGNVELRIAGSRNAPDAQSLDVARRFATVFTQLRDAIGSVLFEHYEPGLDAWNSGEFEGLLDAFPQLSRSSDVWPHVTVDAIDIDASRRAYSTELRVNAAWDPEHTLGVRLLDDQVMGLSGSVGP
jgi:hypothetical protein